MKMNKPVLAGTLAGALLASGAAFVEPSGLQPQAALSRVLTYDWNDSCGNPGGWLNVKCSSSAPLPTPRILNVLRRAGVTEWALAF